MSIQNMKRSETTEQIALFNWAKRTESIFAGIGVDVPCAKRGQKEQWRNIKGGRT